MSTHDHHQFLFEAGALGSAVSVLAPLEALAERVLSGVITAAAWALVSWAWMHVRKRFVRKD